MKIFESLDYREFLSKNLAEMPRRGFGQLAKIADHLDISPSIVTLVLQGQKDFTLEQASDLADYLGLNDLESEYLLVLINFKRAGKESLRIRYRRQIDKLREQAKNLKELIPPDKELTPEAKAIFYSHWYFSAIRMLTGLGEAQSLETLSRRLRLPKNKIREALNFLVAQGLCLEKDGVYKIGPKSTHVGADSMHVTRHHANWRQKAITQLDSHKEDELFFTSPVTVSREDIPRVRALLVEAIEKSFKIIDPSDSQETACLNIDWFRF